MLEGEGLVVVDEMDGGGLQTFQRFVELPRRFRLRAAVDLRHQEGLRAIAVAERLAHADFARAFVVVPAVVEEVDAAIDGGANDPNAEVFLHRLEPEMPAAETNG